MADNSTKPSGAEEEPAAAAAQPPPVKEASTGGGGWGGWGFSPLSYLSDLQKVATVATEEISRNAVEAARTAAKNISDSMAEDLEPSKEDGIDSYASEKESDDENDKRRKAAPDKLEKASEDSILSQGLKVLDTSVESFASGAWHALGTALKGGTDLVHKLLEILLLRTDSKGMGKRSYMEVVLEGIRSMNSIKEHRAGEMAS